MTSTAPQLDRPITADEIIDAVCELSGFELPVMTSVVKRRCFPRVEAAFASLVGCLWELLGQERTSFKEIATLLGAPHHRTAIDAYRHRWLIRSAAERKKDLRLVHGWIYDLRLGLGDAWEEEIEPQSTQRAQSGGAEEVEERGACKGRPTISVFSGGKDMQECVVCGAAVRDDLIDHPFFGFASSCPRAKAPEGEEIEPQSTQRAQRAAEAQHG